MELLKICPVCGYDGLEETPYDKYGYPSYEICSCCGYEYGFQDESKGISFSEYRQKWIEDGFNFSWEKKRPSQWSLKELEEQLKNISKVNYKSRV